jgi:NAD(P)-dependent dehydrogenase (short-subunit alcohol dehydrogenase family)
MMMPAQRVVLITGISKGLGRAMLGQFSAQGHILYGCARSAAALRKLQAEFPPPHQLRMVDVADHAQVERWAAELLAHQPPPDLLIRLLHRNLVSLR